MKFEVLGPYYFPTDSIIRSEHIARFRDEGLSAEDADLLCAPGCYIFGVKPSGTGRIIPWYVGKSERQSVLKEATNAQHLQLYNEILDGYKRARPALYFVPAITPNGRPRTPKTGPGDMPSIEFLEDWLIATALQANSDLWNVRKTKLLRELHVRGILNPNPGEMNSAASSLKDCLRL